MMSAVFQQDGSLQKNFEREFADYLGFESAILCQSGWVANVGLIQAIADENTPVYIDFMTHMSLWEGIKSAGAKTISFRHNDVAHLERLIKQHGVGIIAVDSIYSTNGSVCPLEEIIALGNKYGCILVVDESHSLGTHGPSGKGMLYELGLSNQVHFLTASLAKAFVNRAGIIACSQKFAGYFPYISRPAIFSSSILPADLASLKAALEVIHDAGDLRTKLHENANYLRSGLDELGYNVSDGQSQIIALESGTEEQTEKLRDALEGRDVFGAVFCSPSTPKSRSLIRFSINSDLTKLILDHILKVCAEIREEVGISSWKSTIRKHQNLTKSAYA